MNYIDNLNYTDNLRVSKTYKIRNTPVGNVYITLSYNGDGGIKEIFVRIGKSKADFDNNVFELQGFVNGFSILVSKMLQDGYDINKILDSIQGINTGWSVFRWKGFSVKSLIDLIAVVIKYDLGFFNDAKDKLNNSAEYCEFCR